MRRQCLFVGCHGIRWPITGFCRVRFSERNANRNAFRLLKQTLRHILLFAFLPLSLRADPLPNTQPLTTEGDIASQMIDGIDRFLLKQTDKAIAKRIEQWKPGDNKAKPVAQERRENISNLLSFGVLQDLSKMTLLEQRRAKLANMLGLRDPRPAKVEMEQVTTTDRPSLIAKSPGFEVHSVRWNAFGNVHGEGLFLKPVPETHVYVVLIPDADQTPEELVGLVEGKFPAVAPYLAERRCRIIIPTLIDRHAEKRIAPGRTDGPLLSSREFVQRPSYVLGRHILGFELQKILAAIDWIKASDPISGITVMGYGEGGLLALLAAALDDRIGITCSSGYFGSGADLWKQPLERNIYGFTNEFGDAELTSMVRGYLILEASNGPSVKIAAKGAAPGELKPLGAFAKEFKRASDLSIPENDRLQETGAEDFPDSPLDRGTLTRFLAPNVLADIAPTSDKPPKLLIPAPDPAPRQKRQLDELIAHTQSVLRNSPNVRREFTKNLDTSSLEKYEASAKPYRETFYNDVIGRFDEPLLSLNPRTRKTWDNEKWTGYEVMLDVFPDVFAYGVLLIPKDLKPNEKRPVVVCQHGLEGRPTDTFLNDNKSYHDFAAKLAERGFITFAPQNPYIFTDRFRTLQRKANPIGKTLFSIIIPQHQQIINFLKTLPGVDEKRIAFYGLSYGGKTAMRVPAVLTDYCLSICSADFNEWVWKNAGTDHPYSYVYSGEYEIFEWNLGSTFNYAEMAALIAPRPFMVERGHFDGVSTDEMVAFEFAKVRRLYNGQLKIGDRCEIEFFAGPHTINGKGTFDFLHKHLNWEKR